MVSEAPAKMEKRVLPKRFYRAVEVQQYAAAFSIALDGKLLRTQGRNLLQLGSQELAEAIAAEWDAQIAHIDPDIMPLTRLTNLTIDRASHDRAAWLDEIARYGETDLLCYRADAHSVRGLREKQDAVFGSILGWAAEQGISLNVTDSIMPVAQPAASLIMLRSMAEAASDAELAALAMLVPLLGSAILGLAVWRGRLSVQEALAAARLDEDAQAEQWGEDEEAAALWAAKCREAHAAAQFLREAVKTAIIS